MTASLAREVFGIRFQNPLLLASGTAGYGLELEGVMPLDRLGGLVTKAVSLEPRHGNPAPRVTEVRGGMLAGVESLTVRRPLRAGDHALARASVVGRLGALVKVRAELVCDDETIAEGELLLVLEDAVS